MNECAGGSNSAKAQYNFEHIYKNEIIKWQGRVVRVDSDDSGD